jgi:hypothetical protein
VAVEGEMARAADGMLKTSRKPECPASGNYHRRHGQFSEPAERAVHILSSDGAGRAAGQARR